MSDIREFSKEVSQQIGYYVYRLIDPRNGETFYVGKGCGNRVFQHLLGAIDYYDGVDAKEHDFSKDPYKLQRIQKIREAGLKVIHVIQRWGLKENEAIEVEAALIDCYPGLTNIISGHDSKRGVCNAFELENRLSLEGYEEPDDFRYIIIKVKQWRLDQMEREFGPQKARYEATRYRWKNKIPDIKKFPYVFSVSDGIVREIYQVIDWYDAGEGRIAFNGVPAPKNITERFVGKKIPEQYMKKGMASPFLKSKNL